jgi:uncharacterized protein (DUF111 family)
MTNNTALGVNFQYKKSSLEKAFVVSSLASFKVKIVSQNLKTILIAAAEFLICKKLAKPGCIPVLYEMLINENN